MAELVNESRGDTSVRHGRVPGVGLLAIELSSKVGLGLVGSSRNGRQICGAWACK
jgi:hypothetical protein